MKKSELLRLIKEEINSQTDTPTDVKNLDKAQQKATNVTTANKRIDQQSEFAGAFEKWFSSLGYTPGKVSKSKVRQEVEKVLDKLGYK